MVSLSSGERGLADKQGRQPARVQRFLDEIAQIAENEGMIREMVDCVRQGMRAEVSVRVPAAMPAEGEKKARFDYAMIPDVPVQLTAVRLMADLLHLTQKGTVNINSTDNRVQISLGDQMAELMSVGGPGPDELEVEVKEAFARIRASTGSTDAPKQLEQGAAGGF